jgi:hypothetical protein
MQTIATPALILNLPDDFSLSRVVNEFDRELKFYDNGFGPLWVLRDSMGIVGIVRAETWEEAYECAEDELFPEADEATWEAMAKECDHTGHLDTLMDNDIWQENYGMRPNGRNSTDTHGHGVYQKDLNGEALDRLTPALAETLRLSVYVEQSEEDEGHEAEALADKQAAEIFGDSDG